MVVERFRYREAVRKRKVRRCLLGKRKEKQIHRCHQGNSALSLCQKFSLFFAAKKLFISTACEKRFDD